MFAFFVVAFCLDADSEKVSRNSFRFFQVGSFSTVKRRLLRPPEGRSSDSFFEKKRGGEDESPTLDGFWRSTG